LLSLYLVEKLLLFDIGNEALVALASWSKSPVVFAAYLSVARCGK
jgi:hypothetical protein